MKYSSVFFKKKSYNSIISWLLSSGMLRLAPLASHAGQAGCRTHQPWLISKVERIEVSKKQRCFLLRFIPVFYFQQEMKKESPSASLGAYRGFGTEGTGAP